MTQDWQELLLSQWILVDGQVLYEFCYRVHENNCRSCAPNDVLMHMSVSPRWRETICSRPFLSPHLAYASENNNQWAHRLSALMNAVQNTVICSACGGFVAVSAPSGDRTATLTRGFDFQRGVSY